MNKDNIEEILKSIGSEDIPADVQKIAQETSNNFSSSLKQSRQPKQPILLEQIMKSRITRLAAAAVVTIACVIGLSLWRTTGSGIALADVLARMEQVKAFRCQLSEKMTGEDSSETRSTFLISQEYGWKTTYEELDPNGGESTFEESYRLPDKKTLITILHKQKKYKRTEWDDRWWELWQKGDPRTLLKKIVACKHESLGRSTIDGIEVEGFQTTDPNWLSRIDNRKAKVEVDVKMWADVKTRLPVRYDVTTAYFDQMGDKIIEHDHWLMHDFQWDVPVDAAEFEPVIPDDYTGTVIKYPAHITEETAIEGLKLGVELFGNYPDPERFRNFFTALLSALEKSETPAAMRLKEEIKGLTEDEIGNKLVDFLMPIRGLVRFYIEIQWWDNKDPAYYGETVTPKDADKVLMRWKVSDNEYRVIYGDLHAETVTPEKLAELEAALPK
ncbi:MAG: hypothetical protein ABIF19_08395 [Planctomycetota bacterium]